MTTPIRFPSPKRYASEIDFLERGVYRWLCRLAGTELYRHFKTGEVLPTAEELADWLDARAWPKVRDYIPDYQTPQYAGSWNGEQYRRNVERASAFCLENYDPETIHARAVKGGRSSFRRQSFPLSALMALDGLTAQEQADKLGCSVRTIRNRRADLRARDSILDGPFEPVRRLVNA